MPNAAPWVLDITFPPWNEMNMAMEDCLPSRSTCVHSNVEALNGGIRFKHVAPQVSQQTVALKQFLLSQLEVIQNMPLRNHQGMEWGHWKPVPNSVGQFVFQDDALSRD